jgi:hypothetical protein
MSLGSTCKRLFAALPSPLYDQKRDAEARKVLRCAYTDFLTSRRLYALCVSERSGKLPNGMLVCSVCVEPHPQELFFSAMRMPSVAPENRQCKGIEGVIWNCAHTGVTLEEAKHVDWKFQCRYMIHGAYGEKDCACQSTGRSIKKVEKVLGVKRVGWEVCCSVEVTRKSVREPNETWYNRFLGTRKRVDMEMADRKVVALKHEMILGCFVSPTKVVEANLVKNVDALVQGRSTCPHISVKEVKAWLRTTVYDKTEDHGAHVTLRPSSRADTTSQRQSTLCVQFPQKHTPVPSHPIKESSPPILNHTYTHTLSCSQLNCHTTLQTTIPISPIPPYHRILLLTTHRHIPFPVVPASPVYAAQVLEPDRPIHLSLHNCPPHCCFERFQRSQFPPAASEEEALCCGAGAPTYPCCTMEEPRCGKGRSDAARVQVEDWEVHNARTWELCEGAEGDACFEWAERDKTSSSDIG